MALFRTPQCFHRRFTNMYKAFALLVLVYNTCEILQVLRLSEPLSDPPKQRSERIYIAGLHWNNEHILRSHWNDAVAALAVVLGSHNIFVTVYESGSWDNSKAALGDLDRTLEQLGVGRNITLSDVTHFDEISASKKGSGWVDTPRGKRALRRIPYLSRLRNIALAPLQELYLRGERFDKVLFLNDVIFTVVNHCPILHTQETNVELG